ncbi:2'-5' RNA ligase family protein [Ornithinimicrobium ciconiae]|uniref:2'-5' RNA ligase family protein n=1 Tax=Ornithinimicrobium ciconiae TaxID=2594265 RepID=A0A516G8W7_9MICO|nr:2'-5' RNA ligase family protein [Ornithinimicrobium ciconiae]
MIVTLQPHGPVTVGIALPVPEPWGSMIQQARIDYGEARAQHIPTHVTLLPPTETTAERLEELLTYLQDVAQRMAPFLMVLRGTGTFRPVSDVVYVQIARGVSSCEQLERAVRNGPVWRDLDFPYHPHVTLAHDLPSAVLDRAFAEFADLVAEFEAGEFAVYVHHGDEVWRPLVTYELTGDQVGV